LEKTKAKIEALVSLAPNKLFESFALLTGTAYCSPLA
jgi:hypothetical protein